MQNNKSSYSNDISIYLPKYIHDEINKRTNKDYNMSGLIEDIIMHESHNKQITKDEVENLKKQRRFNVQVSSKRVRKMLDARIKELGHNITMKDYIILSLLKNIENYSVNPLREKILKSGLNISEAAKEIGISRAKLSEIVNNPRKPISNNIYKKIEDYFNRRAA